MARDMFRFDAEMAKPIFDYCVARLDMAPVDLDFGSVGPSLDGVLDGLISEHGNDPEKVMDLFATALAPRVLSADSERFLAFIPAAPTKASLLMDMVVSASSLHAASWLESAGAVVAENQVLEHLACLAGLPTGAGGTFVGGGSIGNLSALVVAREVGRQRTATTEPLAIALSGDAHSSIASALRIIGVEPLFVPTAGHRLTAEALSAALANEPHPERVIGVAATAGTTNAGIIDDLAGIGALTRERQLWFHVDGAYGLAGLFSPTVRQQFAGLEHADSFIVDPHKWLFAPFDSCALVYRQPHLARAVHTQHASYLDVLHDEDKPVEWNPSDYAIQLSRRPKGLPIWFSLAVHGTEAYAEAIDAAVAIADYAASAIAAAPHVELVRPRGLSIVMFRRLGWTPEDYASWGEQMVRDQIAFVTPTKWEGETCARLAFLNPHTTPAIVDEILESMT